MTALGWVFWIGLAWANPPRGAEVAEPVGGSSVRVALPPAEPFAPNALTGEMVAWVHGVVPATGTDDERMATLLRALSRRVELAPDNERTRTASEVFATGRYNCLGLSHLVVGLARELGIDATYVRIRDLRTHLAHDGTWVVSGHVAAAWGAPGRLMVVDPQGASEEVRAAAVRIADREAYALHLVNRGAEHLLRDAPEVALAWFDAAGRLDAGLPELWVDRGVALSALGRADEARQAYEAALALDPDHASAWRNLAGLLAASGDPDAARATLEGLSGRVSREPWTRAALGDAYARVGAFDLARRAYRAAALRDPRSAALCAARGELALDAGDPAAADRWLQRAIRLDPSHPRVERLRERRVAGSSG